MKLPTVYQDAILVTEIMCLKGCGSTVENALKSHLLDKYPNLQIYIAAEPRALGVQQIVIELCGSDFELTDSQKDELAKDLRKVLIDIGFPVLSDDSSGRDNHAINWLNILINVIAIASIITLSLLFPPSLLLSLGLGAICFSATLFTARDYIFNFLKSLSNFKFKSMQVTISLGWLLALVHSAYHLGVMPVMRSFAMTFMNFLMPIVLVTIVNVMDEIKRQIKLRSERLILNGLESLFPQMRAEYRAVALTEDEVCLLQAEDDISVDKHEFVNTKILEAMPRNSLSSGMLIEVKAGDCFPVDGYIVSGTTVVDKSIITGEQPISTKTNMFVEAGCINLWHDVTVLAKTNTYHSTLNAMLFQANINSDDNHNSLSTKDSSQSSFYYFYFGLFAVGFVISLALSIALGGFTVAGMLQTMVGILFAICPCTIAIGCYLPKLLQTYQASNSGIVINNSNAATAADDFDVFVFDKTGTLTANSSVIEVDASIPEHIYAKIYHAERNFGRAHPIANALQNYFQTKGEEPPCYCSPEDIATGGISVNFAGEILYIGNADYMRSQGIIGLPEELSSGSTQVYVGYKSNDSAQGEYQGKILIEHKLRPGMQASLQKLQEMGKTLIMLTGDKEDAAKSLNQQFKSPIFLDKNIYSKLKPNDKADKLVKIANNYGAHKVCFIGDGLNDALCSRKLCKEGGTSFSITENEKAAFFTDISLNGSLDYLFVSKDLAKFEEKIVQQNRWILACGAVIFLTFLISFPALGIGMSPLIPMLVMFSTTIFTLVNSYRARIGTANALAKQEPTLLSKVMQSELVVGLLIGGSLMLVAAVLIASITSLQLALPMFIFSGGAATIASSCFLLAAIVGLSGFVGIACGYALQNKGENVVEGEKVVADDEGLSADINCCFNLN